MGSCLRQMRGNLLERGSYLRQGLLERGFYLRRGFLREGLT